MAQVMTSAPVTLDAAASAAWKAYGWSIPGSARLKLLRPLPPVPAPRYPMLAAVWNVGARLSCKPCR